jgi:hypothetical protein
MTRADLIKLESFSDEYRYEREEVYKNKAYEMI